MIYYYFVILLFFFFFFGFCSIFFDSFFVFNFFLGFKYFFVVLAGDGSNATVLYPGRPENKVLIDSSHPFLFSSHPFLFSSLCFSHSLSCQILDQAWDYKITGKNSTYYALYPRAWTVYQEPDPNVRLTCLQVSFLLFLFCYFLFLFI